MSITRAALDDGHAVAQPLGLLHQVRREQHRLAALADAAHHLPDRPPGLRIEAGRQLVEQHDVGIVDERQRDEEPLPLPSRQRHEPGVPLVRQAEPRQQLLAVHRMRVERGPEIHRLPHRDALLQLRLLELDAHALLQRPTVPHRVEPEHADGAAVRRAEAAHALHRRGLARAVRPDQAEDLAREDVERHVVHGDGRAVGFVEAGYPNRGPGRGHCP